MVIADPADCSLQFDPVGKATFTSSCDIAKSALANAGVSYRNEVAPGRARWPWSASAQTVVPPSSARGLPKDVAKARKASVDGRIKAALTAPAIPAKADPARLNSGGALRRCWPCS